MMNFNNQRMLKFFEKWTQKINKKILARDRRKTSSDKLTKSKKIKPIHSKKLRIPTIKREIKAHHLYKREKATFLNIAIKLS